MSTHWKLAIIACGLGIALVASASGLQDQDGWMRQHASGMFIHRMERQLDITDAQRSQIKSILKNEQPTIQKLAARVREDNDQLRNKSSFDEAYVRNFARQHASTTEDVLVEREKVRTEILQVLAPAQREKLQQMRLTMQSSITERLANLGDQI